MRISRRSNGYIGTRGSAEAYLLGILERSEKLSYYAHSRGWGFVMTWAHRIAGLTLILYMLFHV
jgi:hypothetical protein